MRVKCLAQEYNAISPPRVFTQTSGSGVEHTNHEATSHIHLDKIIGYFFLWPDCLLVCWFWIERSGFEP